MQSGIEIEAQGVAWDARQRYTTEIVWRLHLFLNTNRDDLRQKLEALSDLFYIVVDYIKDYDTVRANLEKIELHLYPPKNTTDRDKASFKIKARRMIDDSYITIFKAIKKAGLLVPEKEYTDEVAEFESML